MAAESPDVLFPTCDRKPTQADIDAAILSHKAGVQLYERGEYDRAIENWRDTYKLDCTVHAVLINVSKAYEKKGDIEGAVAALEAYLKRDPEAPDAKATIERIEALRKQVPPKVEPTATPTVTATVRPPPRLPPPPLPKPERPYGAKPWVPIVLGGAAAITGAILIPVGMSAIASAEEACGEMRVCTQAQGDIASKGNGGRVQVIVGDVALGVGLAAAAGGLVWQFVFNKPRIAKVPSTSPELAPQPKASLTPAAGPGFAGVALTGAF
jgi:hypothetical protein